MTQDDSLKSTSVPSRTARRRRLNWLEFGLIAIITVAAFVGAAISLLHWAQREWGKIASSSNLRQIGMALSNYAKANGGYLPSDWADLMSTAGIELTPDVMTSPFSPYDESRRAPSLAGRIKLVATPGTFATTYVFTASRLNLEALGPDSVTAIEPAEVNDSKGAQILFSDGHTDWIELRGHAKNREAYDRLIKDFAEGIIPLRFAIEPEWRNRRK